LLAGASNIASPEAKRRTRKMLTAASIHLDVEIADLVAQRVAVETRQRAEYRARSRTLVDESDELCPYSKALRGNIDVAINLV